MIFSPIIAQYRAPFNTKASVREAFVLNGDSRSQKRTYEVTSGAGSWRKRVLSFSEQLSEIRSLRPTTRKGPVAAGNGNLHSYLTAPFFRMHPLRCFFYIYSKPFNQSEFIDFEISDF